MDEMHFAGKQYCLFVFTRNKEHSVGFLNGGASKFRPSTANFMVLSLVRSGILQQSPRKYASMRGPMDSLPLLGVS